MLTCYDVTIFLRAYALAFENGFVCARGDRIYLYVAVAIRAGGVVIRVNYDVIPSMDWPKGHCFDPAVIFRHGIGIFARNYLARREYVYDRGSYFPCNELTLPLRYLLGAENTPMKLERRAGRCDKK